MDKISGILPSNSRLTSVDLSKSPTRKGHPNVGQPMNETQMRQAAPKTVLKQISGAYSQVLDAKQKSREETAKINQLQDEFFNSRISPDVQESLEMGREVLIAETIAEPVEMSEEITEEVGTNLSVVA